MHTETAEDTDVVFVSEKSGRSPRSVITQEILRALQRDIDKESQPTGAIRGRPLVKAHTDRMVTLETARSKKKAGASAMKQEEPATAEDLPAKKKKKKKNRNGDDAAPAVGKTSADDGSAGKTGRTTANAVSLRTEKGKDGGAELKQGSKKNQKKKKMKKERKSEDVTGGEVIVIEDGASEGERGSAHGGGRKKRKTPGRREEEEDGARAERKKAASEEVSGALRLSPGEEAGTRRAGTQTESGRAVKTEVKTEEGTGKKKKKGKREDLAEEAAETQEVPSSCNKKKKREESSSGPADKTLETANEGTAERKKKKTRKSSADPADEGDDVIAIDGAEPAKKNAAVSEPKEGKSEGADVKETKGKRRRKKREVERETGDKAACEEGCAPLKKTKKKKKGEAPVKIEREDSDTETSGQVVFLSEKRGNTDEVTVNQARRLALQREVDLESHPKAQTSAAAGQWSSAQFDSTDQQDKFLRLMGGFKRASQPAAASEGRANMALGKEGQQSLQQRLLGEFERAQSRRMDFGGQGAGLGFSAPSNKKFFIDVNARRSVRFDD